MPSAGVHGFGAAEPGELAVYFLGPQPRGLRFLIHQSDLGIRLHCAEKRPETNNVPRNLQPLDMCPQTLSVESLGIT